MEAVEQSLIFRDLVNGILVYDDKQRKQEKVKDGPECRRFLLKVLK